MPARSQATKKQYDPAVGTSKYVSMLAVRGVDVGGDGQAPVAGGPVRRQQRLVRPERVGEQRGLGDQGGDEDRRVRELGAHGGQHRLIDEPVPQVRQEDFDQPLALAAEIVLRGRPRLRRPAAA